MSIIKSLEKRRTYYKINKELPVTKEEVAEAIQKLTELVPDAFNMKSSRTVVVFGHKQDTLWDVIYEVFEGKVPREKIDGFQAGAGTVLYFYDRSVVEKYKENFPQYADNFLDWARQASGMLQLSIWAGLRELGIGASLQHYNPVIDEKIRALFGLPASSVLVAQMPFGGIEQEPAGKEKEEIGKRVRIEW